MLEKTNPLATISSEIRYPSRSFYLLLSIPDIFTSYIYFFYQDKSHAYASIWLPSYLSLLINSVYIRNVLQSHIFALIESIKPGLEFRKVVSYSN